MYSIQLYSTLLYSTLLYSTQHTCTLLPSHPAYLVVELCFQLLSIFKCPQVLQALGQGLALRLILAAEHVSKQVDICELLR